MNVRSLLHRRVPLGVALLVGLGIVIVLLDWTQASDRRRSSIFFNAPKLLRSAEKEASFYTDADADANANASTSILTASSYADEDEDAFAVDKDATSSAPTPAPTTPSTAVQRTRIEKLEHRSKEMLTQVETIRDRLDEAKQQIQTFSDRLIELEEMFVVDLTTERKRTAEKPEFKCIAWRSTGQCKPDGPREYGLDRSCDATIEPRISGFCELEDTKTGERYRVWKTWCDSLKDGTNFRCQDAIEFANFGYQANKVVNETSAVAVTTSPETTNGVVIVVYPRMLPGVFAIVRTLRQFNCTLPVELWYKQSELDPTHPILQHLVDNYGPLNLRDIDPNVGGYMTKIYAIDNSAFTNVLFLDADNVPVRDPTFLFSTPAFLLTGALFWPDYWNPSNTYFNIQEHAPLWEYMDLPFVDSFEQESGQLVINRVKSHRAMEVLKFFAYHTPNYLQDRRMVHGDKDLFRFAWRKANAPFLMISTLPGLAGPVKNKVFCGATMVQHDIDGNILFFHRNAHKLQGRSIDFRAIVDAKKEGKALPAHSGDIDPIIWTHVQDFEKNGDPKNYHIDLYGDPVCYGKESPKSPHFKTFPIKGTEFKDLETNIINYAAEATDLFRTYIENAPADQDVSKYLW